MADPIFHSIFKPCVSDGFVCAVATLQNPAAMVRNRNGMDL